eukprot:TRINITY_DN7952_c0_g3_i1.p1 TRINITY_DN7952_c0_g3~~TRINITY_DN7952_c0_g3_i1.p1  ORF type:complete len:421 (+),score=129.39 TRINITY_DN7952_c0_g3_i1:67-1329(+)
MPRRLPRVSGNPSLVEFAKNFTPPSTVEWSREPPPPAAPPSLPPRGKLARTEEAFPGTAEWDDSDVAQWLMKWAGAARRGPGYGTRLGALFDAVKAAGAGVGVKTYNVMIAHAASAGHRDLAQAWFEEMRGRGVRPNAWVYNSVMHAHARHGDTAAVTQLWAEMEATGTPASDATYATAITAFGTNGMEAEAFDVFGDLDGHPYITPNGLVHAALIAACCTFSKAEAVYAALPEEARTEVVHNAMVQAAANAGEAAAAAALLTVHFLQPVGPAQYPQSHLVRAPTWRAFLHCVAGENRMDLLQQVLVLYDAEPSPAPLPSADLLAALHVVHEAHPDAPFPPLAPGALQPANPYRRVLEAMCTSGLAHTAPGARARASPVWVFTPRRSPPPAAAKKPVEKTPRRAPARFPLRGIAQLPLLD